MERTEIIQTLSEIEGLRRDTRRSLQSFWFPLIVFGAITLASAPFHLIGDGSAVAILWALAGPVGGIVTAMHYARRQCEVGVARPAAPYTVVAAGIMVGAFVLPVLVEGDLQQVVSNFAVAAGYLGFAWIERDGRIAVLAGVLTAVPLAMLAIAPESAGVVTAAVAGIVLLGSGHAFRRAQLAAAAEAAAGAPR